MSVRQRWLVAALAVAALALSACSESAESSESGDAAATLEDIRGQEVPQVVLVPGAAKRLGIETAEVRDDPSTGGKVVPYASVVYDASGETWVYTVPDRLTYMREPITVTNIAGEDAFLSDAPAAGTEIVTVGTAELLGVENEIGA
jgi:hypothetical protein